MPGRHASLVDRLMAKIAMGPDGCWIWTGRVQPNGYGEVRRGNRNDGRTKPHVASFEVFVGPVPPGHDVGHVCHDQSDCSGGVCLHRRCFRPDHLAAQTRSENLKAGRAGGYRERKVA